MSHLNKDLNTPKVFIWFSWYIPLDISFGFNCYWYNLIYYRQNKSFIFLYIIVYQRENCRQHCYINLEKRDQNIFNYSQITVKFRYLDQSKVVSLSMTRAHINSYWFKNLDTGYFIPLIVMWFWYNIKVILIVEFYQLQILHTFVK